MNFVVMCRRRTTVLVMATTPCHRLPCFRLPAAGVLIVDDTAQIRELVTLVLERAGFEVMTASNGSEAVLAADRYRPAVILMDIKMPVMDGIQAARLLRTGITTRDIPIVAHTSEPWSCRDAGHLFAQIVAKPSNSDLLLAALNHLVSR